MKINKGVSLPILIITGVILYGFATYLFYLVMQPGSDHEAKIKITAEEMIDSLASKYDLNIDSLKSSKIFTDALKNKITNEDIEERIYLYDDNYVLNKLAEKEPGIKDSTDYFITDSLREVVATQELLDESFKSFIESNKEKYELRKKLKLQQEENQKLANQIDTLSIEKPDGDNKSDESSKTIEELQKQNRELLKKTNELSGKNLTALVKKYESMKPAKAARILYDMPDKNVVTILKKMQNRQAGKILANLPPSKAAALSVLILMGDNTNNKVIKETLTTDKSKITY